MKRTGIKIFVLSDIQRGTFLVKEDGAVIYVQAIIYSDERHSTLMLVHSNGKTDTFKLANNDVDYFQNVVGIISDDIYEGTLPNECQIITDYVKSTIKAFRVCSVEDETLIGTFVNEDMAQGFVRAMHSIKDICVMDDGHINRFFVLAELNLIFKSIVALLDVME